MKQARRNTLIALSFIICLLSFSTTLCSCSSDDETAADTQEDSNGRRMRQLTISNVSMATRATIDGETLAAGWEEGDKATYFNLTLQGQPFGQMTQGILTAHPSAASGDDPEGASATLSGSVYCGLGDYLAVIYPAVTIEGSAENAYFTINLSGQKGTLADIGARYHYIFGMGDVESVNGGTATATIANDEYSYVKSLLSLCKFTFSKEVKGLEINEYISDPSNKLGYSQGKVSIPASPTLSAVSVKPVANDQALIVDLSANPSKDVYVAMLPDAKTYHFKVTYNDDSTAEFTKRANLLEGKYYELQLTQQQ